MVWQGFVEQLAGNASAGTFDQVARLRRYLDDLRGASRAGAEFDTGRTGQAEMLVHRLRGVAIAQAVGASRAERVWIDRVCRLAPVAGDSNLGVAKGSFSRGEGDVHVAEVARASFSSVVVVPTTPTPMIVKTTRNMSAASSAAPRCAWAAWVELGRHEGVFMVLTCRPGNCAAR